MIDYRVKTFLVLYDTMNYRITAEKLNMTQPAVTQHIQLLEHEYGCKFFQYDKRKLSRTAEAEKFMMYCRTVLYNEERFREELSQIAPTTLHMGATKTIGEFVLTDAVEQYLSDSDRTLSFLVANTETLLQKLEQGELDLALVEGNFDKSKYGSKLFRREPFVGICAKNHPFAGKTIPFHDLFSNTVILREEGSGTREILEHFLGDFGYHVSDFARTVCISNFSLLCRLIADNFGISFVYQTVADANDGIASFQPEGLPIAHEFNYVYLKNTGAEHFIKQFQPEVTAIMLRECECARGYIK